MNQQQNYYIPPIFGYIATPSQVQNTGEVVYLANGEPILMPFSAPLNSKVLVLKKTKTNRPKETHSGESLGDSIDSIENTINSFTLKFTEAFRQLLK